MTRRLLLALVGLALSATAAAAITVEDHERQLAGWAHRASEAAAQAAAHDANWRQAIASLAEEIPDRVQVELPSGRPTEVYPGWVGEEARRIRQMPADRAAPELRALAGSLALARKSARTAATYRLDPEAVRRAAAKVFASSDFRQSAPNPWLDRVLRRLADWFSRMHLPAVGASPVLSWLIVIGFGAVLLIGAVLLLRGLSWRRRPAETEPAAEGRPAALPPEAADLWLAAGEAAAAGRYAHAVRFLYQALLLVLSRRGLLAYRPSMTHRECLSRLAPEVPDGPVRDFTHLFELTCYANQPASAAQYRSGLEWFAQVVGPDYGEHGRAARPTRGVTPPAKEGT